jgi:hypothetical protein
MKLFRKRSGSARLLTLAASLVFGVGALTAAGVVKVPAANATTLPVVTICLKDAPSYCADVKSNNNAVNETVWIWSHGGDDLWYEVATPCGDGGCACPDTDCIEFEDVANPALCISATPSENATLQNCQLAAGGSLGASWVHLGDGLRNAFWTNQYLSVEGPLYNGDPMFVAYLGQPNLWYSWIGP